jgi:pimeloyl-ACP methyl ester carboxylesterase
MEKLIVNSGAAQLAVTREGSGQPFVFLHAGVADQRSWQPLVDALSKSMHSFRGVAYDRRCFGDSTYTEERYSKVDDCVAVLDACRLSSAVLVGNSQGGRIAIDTALLHASRVRALVLIGTSVSGVPAEASYLPAIDELGRKLEVAEASGDLDELNRLEAQLWLDGPLSPEGRVSGVVRELFLDMNLRALSAKEVGEATDDIDAWNKLSEIRIPVLVIVGRLDLPNLLQRSAQIAEIVPDAELVTMENVAHLPALEAPRLCAEIIAEFLVRHHIG